MHSQQLSYKEIFNNIDQGGDTPAASSAASNPIFADINNQLQNMLGKINNFDEANKLENSTIVKNYDMAHEDIKIINEKLDNISIALLAEYEARKEISSQILAKLTFLTEELMQLKKLQSQDQPAEPVSAPNPKNWQDSLTQLFSDDNNLPPFDPHPYQDPLSKDGANRLIKRATTYQKAIKGERLKAI
ncbi:hypothetical protein [Bartonella sp. TP]|uniref:hypothetical protein n=1 Tax=Bartonella sp. TP TaxID=3057550 RepID=UPI0025B11B5D|nr:hypothetical protein [Bartonella sp. TP]WJW80344.1 hypothetical protein QVL57_01920 [Bartonella sp. TP]